MFTLQWLTNSFAMETMVWVGKHNNPTYGRSWFATSGCDSIGPNYSVNTATEV